MPEGLNLGGERSMGDVGASANAETGSRASHEAAKASSPYGFDPVRGDLFNGSTAIISECGRYRYRLERDGPGEGRTVVIMVNPSTADADTDDATIRKLKGFGARNGWGRIIVGNLFAYRATDVRELATVDDPFGPRNDWHLHRMIDESSRVIVAWGPPSKLPRYLRNRWREVCRAFPLSARIFSIGGPALGGHPKHPLMLAYDTPIVPWNWVKALGDNQ